MRAVDKIVAKLATWKGMLLSMAGRTQLVKSVIQSMLVFTMMIYAWPRQLVQTLQMKVNNFIWSGDVQKRGYTQLNGREPVSHLRRADWVLETYANSIVHAWQNYQLNFSKETGLGVK